MACRHWHWLFVGNNISNNIIACLPIYSLTHSLIPLLTLMFYNAGARRLKKSPVLVSWWDPLIHAGDTLAGDLVAFVASRWIPIKCNVLVLPRHSWYIITTNFDVLFVCYLMRTRYVNSHGVTICTSPIGSHGKWVIALDVVYVLMVL